jgi:hypothetical protein
MLQFKAKTILELKKSLQKYLYLSFKELKLFYNYLLNKKIFNIFEPLIYSTFVFFFLIQM